MTRKGLASKIHRSVLVTTGISFALAMIVLTVYQYRIEANAITNRAHSNADLIANSSRAAMAFWDEGFAQRLIDGAYQADGVLGAALIGADGEVLAENLPPEIMVKFDGTAALLDPLNHDQLIVGIRPVVLDGDRIGTSIVLGDHRELESAFLSSIAFVLLSILAIFLIASMVSWQIQRQVASPIHDLAAFMSDFGTSSDRTQRLEVQGDHEIRDLHVGFNRLLDELAQHEAYIEGERQRLESEVRARTKELRRANERLEVQVDVLDKARAEAEQAAAAKTEFLANMSHEIRTPMNGVIGMLQLLRESDLDTEQLDQVATMDKSATALLAILNEILDLSKIEANKLELELIEARPIDVLDEVVAMMYNTAREKGVEIVCEPDLSLFNTYRVDTTRLRQVLLNLVGNAVKFTAAGQITLTGQASHPNPDTTMLGFSVIDTGIGIAPDAQRSLFDAFTQADASTTRKYGGTGLGLTISQRLVQLMNGAIEVQSKLGEGSRFTFSFPAEHISSPEQPKGTAPAKVHVDIDSPWRRYLDTWLEANGYSNSSNPADWSVIEHSRAVPGSGVILWGDPSAASDTNLQPPLNRSKIASAFGVGDPSEKTIEIETSFQDHRVLVVEDNLVNQKVVLSMLKRLGLKADTANNGVEALAALRRGSDYGLVLMDCQMPEMDGFETTRAIRSREHETHLPIVALTANAMEGDERTCLEAGMDAYLSKPVRIKELEQTLSRWLT